MRSFQILGRSGTLTVPSRSSFSSSYLQKIQLHDFLKKRPGDTMGSSPDAQDCVLSKAGCMMLRTGVAITVDLVALRSAAFNLARLREHCRDEAAGTCSSMTMNDAVLT